MAKGYEQQQYEKQLSEAASLLAGEVPAGKERDYLIELSRRFKPTPQWPDGLYCWRYDDAMVTYVRRFGGEWLDSYGMPDVQMIPPKGVTRVRVLGDDEIAVKRAAYLDDWEISQTRLYGGELRSCGNACHLAAAQLVENYADALEAEAGA